MFDYIRKRQFIQQQKVLCLHGLKAAVIALAVTLNVLAAVGFIVVIFVVVVCVVYFSSFSQTASVA